MGISKSIRILVRPVKYPRPESNLIRNNNRYFTDLFVGAPTKTMINSNATLKTLQDESFIKIILGTENINYFDEYVKQWKSQGGNDITKEVNDWYDTAK